MLLENFGMAVMKSRFFPVIIIVFLLFGVAAAQDAFPITPGSYEGNINDTTFSVRYSFEAQEGDTVTITMETTSGDLDPFLLLLGPTGRLLATNDDRETGVRDAQIVQSITRSGTYTIEATRFDQETGTSSGTFRLTLEVSGAVEQTEIDPLSAPPPYGVDYTFVDFEEIGAGTIDEENPLAYFVLGGQQGDFVRIIMTATSGDLQPRLNVLNPDLTVISQTTTLRSGEIAAFATLPERGWYLIEASADGGTGTFDIYPTRLATAVIQLGETLQGQFTADTPTIGYIINAHVGDNLIASLTLDDPNSGVVPELSVLDLNLQNIGQRQFSEGATTRIRARIPRSGTYILQLHNARQGVGGSFTLTLGGIAVDVNKLSTITASYNERYKDSITNRQPIDYYRFSGKAGEVVTIQMTADVDSALDPFLALTDAQLNELAFNDNTGTGRDARILQFPLPADGDYYILATRAGLLNGTTTGDYDLVFTVGQIALQPGAVTATLEWSGEADLNLFVRAPTGRIVSWAVPRIPSGGALQIDSNTNCETPSAQPVEHIFWPPDALLEGTYDIWVWYQNDCMMDGPVAFSLNVTVNGETILEVSPEDNVTLRPDNRYEAQIRVVEGGQSFVIESGNITRPTPQQRASQGGDTPIVYGQSVTATISDQVYGRFYRFAGNEGDTIRITAETLTGTLDPILVLRDADDNNLAVNDDISPSNRNAVITYTLPANGQYIIAVTRYGLREGTTNGDYRLTLELIPSPQPE